jgi:methionyl-tRNA formyltransferase
VRGCNPWPGAALLTPAGRLLLWRAAARPAPGVTAPPGTLVPSPLPLSPQGRGQGEGLSGEGPLAIATADGLLVPLEVQPENRNAMPWADFLRGARLAAGARVSEPVP